MSREFWLRAAGDDAFAERELASSDRKALFSLLSSAIKALILKHIEAGRALSLGDASRLCAVLEAVFILGWREERHKGTGYWKVVAEVLRSGVTDAMVKENLAAVGKANLRTDLGRGRLFVRLALLSKTLAYCVNKLQDSTKVLDKFYDSKRALWGSDEGAPIASLLISLNAVTFEGVAEIGSLDERISMPNILDEVRASQHSVVTIQPSVSAKKLKKKKSVVRRLAAVVSPVGGVPSDDNNVAEDFLEEDSSPVAAPSSVIGGKLVADEDVPNIGLGVSQKTALEISEELMDSLALLDAESNSWRVDEVAIAPTTAPAAAAVVVVVGNISPNPGEQTDQQQQEQQQQQLIMFSSSDQGGNGVESSSLGRSPSPLASILGRMSSPDVVPKDGPVKAAALVAEGMKSSPSTSSSIMHHPSFLKSDPVVARVLGLGRGGVLDEWDEPLHDDEKDPAAPISPMQRLGDSPVADEMLLIGMAAPLREKSSGSGIAAQDDAITHHVAPRRLFVRSPRRRYHNGDEQASVEPPAPDDMELKRAAFLTELKKLEDERRKLQPSATTPTMPAPIGSIMESADDLSPGVDDDEARAQHIVIRESPLTKAPPLAAVTATSSERMPVISRTVVVQPDDGDLFFRSVPLQAVATAAHPVVLSEIPQPSDVVGSVRDLGMCVEFLHRVKNPSTFISQQNRCADCMRTCKESRFCTFFGKWFCTRCHSNQTSVIPVFVVSRLDCQEYSVCNFAKKLILSLSHVCLLDCTALNPGLIRASPEMALAMRVRRQITSIDEFIAQDCGVRNPYYSEMRLVFARKKIVHLLETDCLFTLRDLLLCQQQRLVPMLREVLQVYIRHVLQCVDCVARAERCPVCEGKVFSFDLKNVVACKGCGSLVHKRCADEHQRYH